LTTFDAVQQIKNKKPAADVEQSNATHKYFNDVLTKAFNVLGGDSLDPEDTLSLEKEDKWVHTYKDLMMFIMDFQKLASGRRPCKHSLTAGTQHPILSVLQMMNVLAGIVRI
jgi:hypothetical protein